MDKVKAPPDDRTALKVHVPRALHRDVRMTALARGQSMREYVQQILSAEMEKRPRKRVDRG